MTSAEPKPSFATTRPADQRSPFVRTAELLAGIAPGQTPINLSVGEPQHPVPDFAGPILAANVASLGRYPLSKGTDRFRAAAAAWLAQRYALPRAPDPASEVLVLNGTREGLFLAAFAARHFVGPRAGTPAILTPNPFYAVRMVTPTLIPSPTPTRPPTAFPQSDPRVPFGKPVE